MNIHLHSHFTYEEIYFKCDSPKPCGQGNKTETSSKLDTNNTDRFQYYSTQQQFYNNSKKKHDKVTRTFTKIQ